MGAFICFSLTASAAYLFNDLADVADDRRHPQKRRRPIAAGNLSLSQGWLVWPTLLILAFTIAHYFLPATFLASLAVYFVLTIAYSIYLKHIAVVDVLTLASLYTLRVVAGAQAISAQLSFWLLAFSIFIFLSLAFMKRFSELKAACSTGSQEWIRGRGYIREDLELVSAFGTGAGYMAALVMALYIQDSHTVELYRTPEFIWLACPLLLFWICRAWFVAYRGQMHEDPILFTLHDRVSWLVCVCLIVVFGLARVVK